MLTRSVGSRSTAVSECELRLQRRLERAVPESPASCLARRSLTRGQEGHAVHEEIGGEGHGILPHWIATEGREGDARSCDEGTEGAVRLQGGHERGLRGDHERVVSVGHGPQQVRQCVCVPEVFALCEPPDEVSGSAALHDGLATVGAARGDHEVVELAHDVWASVILQQRQQSRRVDVLRSTQLVGYPVEQDALGRGGLGSRSRGLHLKAERSELRQVGGGAEDILPAASGVECRTGLGNAVYEEDRDPRGITGQDVRDGPAEPAGIGLEVQEDRCWRQPSLHRSGGRGPPGPTGPRH